jgi:hypothetical protein
MLLIVLLIAIGGFSLMWIAIVHALGPRTKLFLARRQWLFLIAHVPVMMFMASIGGEGLIIALSNLIGGLVGQGYLAAWGKRQGLSWVGKRTPMYYKLHPPRKKSRKSRPVVRKLQDLW